VISDRVDHCTLLYNSLKSSGINARLLTGGTSSNERSSIVKELNETGADVLVSTIQLIGEGFDLKSLSSIFITTPFRFSGRVKQCIGRILRAEKDKKAVIYDYIDTCGVLKASFRARCTAYLEMGVDIEPDILAGLK